MEAPLEVVIDTSAVLAVLLGEPERKVREAWTSFARIPLRLLEIAVPRALSLAEQLGLSAHDAYVIEAARAQRVPLLSPDGRLRAAAAEVGLEACEVTG